MVDIAIVNRVYKPTFTSRLGHHIVSISPFSAAAPRFSPGANCRAAAKPPHAASGKK